MRRLVQPELVDEDLRQLVVPVLAGMDDDLVDPGLVERDGERRRLDELRPVADDGHHAHRASVVPRVRRPVAWRRALGKDRGAHSRRLPPPSGAAGSPARRNDVHGRASVAPGDRRFADAAAQGGPRAPRRDPVRLRDGLPAGDARRSCIAAQEAVVELLEGAGVENVRSLELPDTAPVVLGEIPAPEGAPTVLLYGHYDVVPAGDEAKWDVTAVRADRARRRALRPRLGGHEVEHPRPRRRAAGLGGASARRDQGRDRRAGGGRQRAQRLPRDAPRPLPGRRDGDRGHGQRAPGRADADDRPARHGADDDGGRDARRPEALRPVRRRRTGRAGRAPAGARDTPRRERRRRRRRPRAGGLDRRRLHRGRVPRARGGRRTACRSSARAISARASGRAPRSPSPASTSPPSTTRSTPSTRAPGRRSTPACTRRRTPTRPRRRSSVTSRPAAVRDRADRPSRRDRQRIPRRDDGPGVRGRARGDGGGVGHRGLVRGDRRLDPARQRAPRGRARGRDPAPRHDRRLREHPCAERARAARGVREGGARRDGVPRPLRRGVRGRIGRGGS